MKCNDVGEVEAWLAPANDPTLSSLPCGPYDQQEQFTSGAGSWTTPQPGDPSASTLALADGCKTSDAVSLTLVAP
jgi:hypothetical protein